MYWLRLPLREMFRSLSMLMSADQCCLLVVDIQSRLLPVIAGADRVVDNASVLIRAAKRLQIPVIASEQYPKGLGPTVPAVASLLPEESTLHKVHFSCMDDNGLRARLAACGRKQVVVAGIEAHVCVLQTVMQLLQAGYETFAVEDAMSSRTRENHTAGIKRMAGAGAEVVTTEMAVFEWLGKSSTPEFKELSALIK